MASTRVVTDKELGALMGGTKTPPSSPSPSVVNEEGDASMSLNDPNQIQQQQLLPGDTQLEMDSLSKQRLGAYKHFARAANRTLTSFTNEMSEILRQSIERLDTISMKVRGCVYDMERQRVGMPLAGISEELGEDCEQCAEPKEPLPTTCLFKGQSNLTEIAEDVNIWDNLNQSPRNSKTVEIIKEIAVKCKKINSDDEDQPVEKRPIQIEKEKQSPSSPKKQMKNLDPSTSDKLQLELLHQNISNEKQQPKPKKQVKSPKGRAQSVASPTSANPSPTTSKRNESDGSLSRRKSPDEKQVMQKIIKTHRRTMKAAKRNLEGEDSSDLDKEAAPVTASKPKPKPIAENEQQLSRLRERYETRYRRHHRKRDAATVVTTHNPTQKRAKRSKLINEAYVKENYNDSLWFGPKLSNIVQEAPKKEAPRSVPSTKSSNKTNRRDSLPSASKMLARKFGNSNFHDPGNKEYPLKTESYTGGKIVRLTSDSKQDWSVIMHTQKSPTKYELKQNSPFPTNNILDEVTLKDLEPLKAEYPRRDNLSQTQPRLEDSLLYKLVHGDVTSLEHLIDVSSASKQVSEEVKKTPKRKSLKQISILSAAAQIQMPNLVVTSTAGTGTGTGILRNDGPPMLKVHSKIQTGSARELYKLEAEAKRAGINRSRERRNKEMALLVGGKKSMNAKQIVTIESKRIAKKLSEIKNQTDKERTSAKSISVQDYQSFRQISKKDARRRLKKYIVDPNKAHQKYMVMMVHQVEYDEYSIGDDGRYHQRQDVEGPENKEDVYKKQQDIAAFLAPYIYINDPKQIVPPQVEYTVAVITGTKTDVPVPFPGTKRGGSPPRRRSFGGNPMPDPVMMYSVKPTRDRERLNDVMAEGRSFRSRRRFESMVTQTGPSTPITSKSDAASWKQAIRTCYVPREPVHHHAPPPPPPQRSTNMDMLYSGGHGPMDPNHVRTLITNMEQQLKQVMDNPKIENKSLVIKSLQDEMEWILTNLEGHTSSLKKRKSLKGGSTPETRIIDKRRPLPILKPAETIKTFKASKALPIPTNITLSSPQYSYEQQQQQTLAHLKKSVGTTELHCCNEETSSCIKATSSIEPAVSPPTNPKDDIHSKLMSKWQALEHPSIETLESRSTKDISIQLTADTTPSRNLEPKKVKSRPETRRENRSSFMGTKQMSVNNNIIRKENESMDTGRYITECPEHFNLVKRRCEQVSNQALDQLLAKLDDDDDNEDDDEEENADDEIGEQKQYEVEERPSSSEEESSVEIPTNDRIDDDSGGSMEVTLEASKEDNSQISKDYKNSFQLFENKLGEETKRFVHEMAVVMEKVEPKNDDEEDSVEMCSVEGSHLEENRSADVAPNESGTAQTLTMWEQCTMVPSVKTLPSDATSKISSVIISPAVQDSESPTKPAIHVFQMYKPDIKVMDVPSIARAPLPPPRAAIRVDEMLKVSPIPAPRLTAPREIPHRRKSFNLKEELVDKDPPHLFRNDLEAKSMHSPMMCDIKKRLFSSQQRRRTTTIARSLIVPEDVANARCKKWETRDKSTGTRTASLTNLDAYSKGTQHSSTLVIKESHSEITLRTQSVDSRMLRATIIQSKDSLSLRMKNFLNSTSLAHMSDSLEDILASTLAATLANQEAIKQRFCRNDKDSCNFAARILPCVYGVCFAVVSIALTFKPMCIT